MSAKKTLQDLVDSYGDFPAEQTYQNTQRSKLTNGKASLNCVRLSAVEGKKIEWLWNNRIPLNTLTILEGDGGRGKSTVLAEICSRLSNGESLVDDPIERRALKILLLAAEDDPGCVLRPRFEVHGANLENVMFDDQAMILNADGIEALSKAIKEHSINVVIIDPIVPFLGQKIDMNKGNDVRSVLGPLVKLGRELNCTLIVVRHFNKNREGSSSQRGAGSVDFRNAARSVLQVLHSEGKSYLVLEKSNYAAKAKTLEFTIEDRRVKWGEESDLTADEIHSENRQGSESKTAFDDAIEFLETEMKDGPRGANEISRNARENGISERTLLRAKSKLGIKSKKLPSGWKWIKTGAVEECQGSQVAQTKEVGYVGSLNQERDPVHEQIVAKVQNRMSIGLSAKGEIL